MAEANVNTPSKAYEALAVHWHLPSALRGGTLGMRAEKTKYLPQFPQEKNPAYDDRLNQSVLYNAFWRTVGVLSAKPFAKPVQLTEESDEDFKLWAKNIDGAGRDLTAFAHDLMQDILAFGLCRFAVDFPRVERRVNLHEERILGLRPYFAQISPLSMIGWKEQRIGAISRMVEARIRHTDTVPDGAWGEKDQEQVFVRTSLEFQVYVKQTGSQTQEWPSSPERPRSS